MAVVAILCGQPDLGISLVYVLFSMESRISMCAVMVDVSKGLRGQTCQQALEDSNRVV